MRLLARLALAASLAACSDPPAQGALTVARDDGFLIGNKSMGPHADTVRATMRQPLVVMITDRSGVPVPGVDVHWQAFDGADISDRTMATDAGGESAVSLILGSVIGTYRARAYVPGIEGSPVEFTARAHAGSPIALEKARGDGLEVTAGASVVHTVRVTDSYGNPVHGVPIEWTAADGASTFWPRSFTNKQGLAEMTSRTNERAVWHRVTARATTVPGAPLVTFVTRLLSPESGRTAITPPAN